LLPVLTRRNENDKGELIRSARRQANNDLAYWPTVQTYSLTRRCRCCEWLLVMMTTSRAAAAAKGGRNEICVACGLVSSDSVASRSRRGSGDWSRPSTPAATSGTSPARSTHSPNEWERRRHANPNATQTDRPNSYYNTTVRPTTVRWASIVTKYANRR